MVGPNAPFAADLVGHAIAAIEPQQRELDLFLW